MNGGPSQMDLFDPKPKLNHMDGKPFPGNVEEIGNQSTTAIGVMLGGRYPFAQHAHSGHWLADVLPDRPDGLTVVSHSVVWRYVPTDEQDAVIRLLDDVGGSATASSPLVWLRLEPRPPAMVYDGTPYPLLATTWPGGETVELGVAQAHGQDLRWSPRPFVPDS